MATTQLRCFLEENFLTTNWLRDPYLSMWISWGWGTSIGCGHLSQVSNFARDLVYCDHSGNYSIYGVNIALGRSIQPFMYSIYFPSGLIVILSWVRHSNHLWRFKWRNIFKASFFIPSSMILMRMIHLLVLFFLLINMYSFQR